MDRLRYYVESNLDVLSKKLADYLYQHYKNNLNPVFALSGGNTPKLMYYYLSEKLIHENKKLTIIMVDERYVSKDSDRSNQKMIYNIFKDIKCVNFIPIPSSDTEPNIEKAVKLYSKIIDDLNITLTILGMGTDGHTASMFPNSKGYVHNLSKNVNVFWDYIEQMNEYRISLSANKIKASEVIVIFMTGKEKGITFKRAITSGDKKKYPILQAITDRTRIFLDAVCYNQIE